MAGVAGVQELQEFWDGIADFGVIYGCEFWPFGFAAGGSCLL
jgi:hypothetical protein